MRPKTRLWLELLEGRDLMSTFGVPWPDAGHLKVSFVPDGTLVGGTPSVLFQDLNARNATPVWQREILRAIQTWADQTNINVGLVSDGGQPLGSPGAIEGDTRFGDIRIAAKPLPADEVAIASPFDPVEGTRAGDIILNSSYPIGVGQPWSQYDLYSVVLHEVGHSLGLPDNTDWNSAMYEGYNGVQKSLDWNDISGIQGLYGGSRAQDQYEGPYGNNTFATASPISSLDIQADLTNVGSVDYYQFTMPANAVSTVTVQVQSAGLSLFIPKLSVYDAGQNLVASAAAADALSNTVSVTLTNVLPGATYYFKVEGAQSGTFGAGAYRLKAFCTPDAAAQIQALDAVYDGTATRGIVVDQHTNDTLSTATALTYRQDPRFDYTINGSISDATDVDFYSVTVPQSAGAAPYLIASARAIDSAVLYPTINVFDQSGNPQSVNIVVEDAGDIVAQVANVIPGATYYVEVAAAGNAGSHNTGAYVLGVNFRSAGLVLPLMASDTLSSSTSGLVQDVFTMNVSQSQLVTYTLSASAPGATAPEAVRMRIYDQYGNVMFTLDALNGQTVSGSAFLPLGKYTVVFTAATQDGSPLAPFTYRLRGKAVTDPLCPVPISPTGPAPDDPTLTTGGTAPSDPSASPWTPAS